MPTLAAGFSVPTMDGSFVLHTDAPDAPLPLVVVAYDSPDAASRSDDVVWLPALCQHGRWPMHLCTPSRSHAWLDGLL